MIIKLDIIQYSVTGVDNLELVGHLSLINDENVVYYSHKNVSFQFNNAMFLSFLKEIVSDPKFRVTWFGSKLYIDERERLYCKTKDNGKMMFNRE